MACNCHLTYYLLPLVTGYRVSEVVLDNNGEIACSAMNAETIQVASVALSRKTGDTAEWRIQIQNTRTVLDPGPEGFVACSKGTQGILPAVLTSLQVA